MAGAFIVGKAVVGEDTNHGGFQVWPVVLMLAILTTNYLIQRNRRFQRGPFS